jgi:hypothetical protein
MILRDWRNKMSKKTLNQTLNELLEKPAAEWSPESRKSLIDAIRKQRQNYFDAKTEEAFRLVYPGIKPGKPDFYEGSLTLFRAGWIAAEHARWEEDR